VANNVTFIEAADVNGDRLADFFTIDTTTDRIEWWANSPAEPGRSFDRHLVTANASSTDQVERLDAADIDGDGLVDFVTANPGAGRMTWWRHEVDAQGEHHFSNVLGGLGLAEDRVKDVSAADTDLDGDVDFLAMTEMPYRVFEWRRQPDGGFARQPQAVGNVPDDIVWASIDKGDVDGDGAVDFVVTEPVSGGRLCWYENPLVVDVATATPSEAATSEPPTGTPSPTGTLAPYPTAATPSPTVRTPAPTPSPTARTPAPTPPETATRPTGLRYLLALPYAGQRR